MRADREKVQQILLNLLSNAVKFTPPGGQVTVNCGAVPEPDPGAQIGEAEPEASGGTGVARPERAWAFIRVEDTGVGIAPDLLLAGNFDGFKPEIGRAAASYGLLLRGDGTGAFTPLRAPESGFFVPGQARDIQRIDTQGGTTSGAASSRPLVRL